MGNDENNEIVFKNLVATGSCSGDAITVNPARPGVRKNSKGSIPEKSENLVRQIAKVRASIFTQ